MKRYLAFSYSTYYPSGAENDYIGDFDSIREALHCAFDGSCPDEWCDIMDTDTGKWMELEPGDRTKYDKQQKGGE
jgi:hypothetical protein